MRFAGVPRGGSIKYNKCYILCAWQCVQTFTYHPWKNLLGYNYSMDVKISCEKKNIPKLFFQACLYCASRGHLCDSTAFLWYNISAWRTDGRSCRSWLAGLCSAVLIYRRQFALGADNRGGVQIETPKAPRGGIPGYGMGSWVCPSPADWGICESVISSHSGVRGKAPAENEFWMYLELERTHLKTDSDKFDMFGIATAHI